MRLLSRFAILISLLSVSWTVSAYIGPGLGLGAVGTALGLLLSLLLAVIALVWYPIKRVIRKLREGRVKSVPSTDDVAQGTVTKHHDSDD